MYYLTAVCIYRMCRSLMPGDDDNMSDEAIWETLPVSHINIVPRQVMNTDCRTMTKSKSFIKSKSKSL